MRWIDDGVVEGWAEERFTPLADAFQASFRAEAPLREHGAALAVTLDGRPVVDLWGGFEDEGRTRRLRSHGLLVTFSAVKALAALSVHILEERGLLDLDRPIADVWPAFARNGKDKITTRDVLTHSAGLQSVSGNDLALPFDEEVWRRVIEEATPLNPVGAVRSYHAASFGQIIGEVIRRVSGRSARVFLQEEVCDPLAADTHIGVSEAAAPRIAGVLAPSDEDFDHFGITEARVYLQGVAARLNDHAARTGVFPFGAGFTTARGLARIYGALAQGGIYQGVRICADETVARLATLAWDEVEQQTNLRWRMAQGVVLTTPPFHDYGPSPAAFGHAGAGGANGFADPRGRLSFAYLPVRIFPTGGAGLRSAQLIAAAYTCL